MAATEVIHFPDCVQLNRGATIRADAFRDTTASAPGFPRHLLYPPPVRPDNTAPTGDGGLWVCVEIARVYANREFFDNFEKIVEDDARWAYWFQHKFHEKLKVRDDIYLEVKSSEERRKRKRLPPRVVILPGWDMSDEDCFDDDQARRRTKTGAKKRRTQPRSKGVRR